MWWWIFISCSELEFKIVLMYVCFLTYCYYSSICVTANVCIRCMLFLCNSPFLFWSHLHFSSFPLSSLPFPSLPFPSLLIPQVCVLHCRCSIKKTFWLLFTIRNSEKQHDTFNPKSRFCLWLQVWFTKGILDHLAELCKYVRAQPPPLICGDHRTHKRQYLLFLFIEYPYSIR